MKTKYYKYFMLLLGFIPMSLILAQSSELPNILICITDDQSWVHTSMISNHLQKELSTTTMLKISETFSTSARRMNPSCSGSGARLGVNLDEVTVHGFLPDVPEVRADIADYLGEIKWVDQHKRRS